MTREERIQELKAIKEYYDPEDKAKALWSAAEERTYPKEDPGYDVRSIEE